MVLFTHRTSFSFSTTSLAEMSVSAVHAADSVKSSDATMGDAVDDPIVVSMSILAWSTVGQSRLRPDDCTCSVGDGDVGIRAEV